MGCHKTCVRKSQPILGIPSFNFFLPWEARSHHPHSSGFAHPRLQLSFFFFHQTHFPSAGETSYIRRDMSSPYVCHLDTELLRVSPHSEALSGTAREAPFLLEYEPSGKTLQNQRWHTGCRYSIKWGSARPEFSKKARPMLFSCW